MPSPTLEQAPSPAVTTPAPSSGLTRWVVALVALLLCLAVVAVVLAVGSRHDAAHEQRDRAVLVAARSEIDELVNISPSTAQEQFDRAVAGATGEWKQRLVSDGGGLTQAVTSAQVNSHATISEAGVQSADEHQAKVLLVAQLYVGNAQSPASDPRPLRVALALTRDDGGPWLVSNVEFVP